MKKTLRVIVNPNVDNSEYIKFLQDKFEVVVIQGITKSSDIVESDVLLLIDGPDVNPQYYTEKLGKLTTIDKERDEQEKRLFDLVKKYKKLKLGFGRGAHLVAALSGAKVVQSINGHDSSHEAASFLFKSRFNMPSSHKQMMYPYELPESKYNLIAWSRKFQSTTYLDGNNEEMDLDEQFLEPEIIHFPVTNSLAFQGVPDRRFSDYSSLIYTLIDSNLK